MRGKLTAQEVTAMKTQDSLIPMEVETAASAGEQLKTNGRELIGQHRGLIVKLCEVMAATGWVEKSGTNQKQGYAYATESDVLSMLRKELSQRHVFVFPSVENVSRTPLYTTQSGSQMHATDVMVKWTFLDGETGETHECHMPGCGADTGDKGLYKAITGSSKYMFLKAFMLPTGDDPEEEALTKDDKKEMKQAAASVAVEKLKAHAAGDESITMKKFDDRLYLVYGPGLPILRAQLSATDMGRFQIEIKGRDVYVPVAHAFELGDFASKQNVTVNWSDSGATTASMPETVTDRASKDIENTLKESILQAAHKKTLEAASGDPTITKCIEKKDKNGKPFVSITWNNMSMNIFDKKLIPLFMKCAEEHIPVWIETDPNGKYINFKRLVRMAGMDLVDEQAQVDPTEQELPY